MELLLVRRFDTPEEIDWEPVHTVFENRAMAVGSDTYNWTVPNVRYGGFVAIILCKSIYASPATDSSLSTARTAFGSTATSLRVSGTPIGRIGSKLKPLQTAASLFSLLVRLLGRLLVLQQLCS